MERNDSERERKDPERADPITRLIASRVREIRLQQRLSGAALGSAVRDLGLQGWVDSTVGKLETRRRESVTVRELLALSVALDVPPVWLLADPKAGTPVPIAEGIVAEPHLALLWMTGRWPLSDQPGAAWGEASDKLAELHAVVNAMTVLRTLDKLGREPAPTPQHKETQDEMIRQQLESIRWSLSRLEESGAEMSMPPHVLSQAKRLGVELPGQEREESAP